MSGWQQLALLALLLVVVAWSSSLVVRTTHEERELFGELQELQARHDALLAEQSRLLLERAARASYQRVEQVAQRELNMRFPAHAEIVAP